MGEIDFKEGFEAGFAHAREDFEAGERLTLRALIAERDALREACEDFCKKVETGQAKSKQSYAQMKAALNFTVKEPE